MAGSLQMWSACPVTNEDWLSTEKWIMGAGLNLEFFSLRDG